MHVLLSPYNLRILQTHKNQCKKFPFTEDNVKEDQRSFATCLFLARFRFVFVSDQMIPLTIYATQFKLLTLIHNLDVSNAPHFKTLDSNEINIYAGKETNDFHMPISMQRIFRAACVWRFFRSSLAKISRKTNDGLTAAVGSVPLSIPSEKCWPLFLSYSNQDHYVLPALQIWQEEFRLARIFGILCCAHTREKNDTSCSKYHRYELRSNGSTERIVMQKRELAHQHWYKVYNFIHIFYDNY